MASSSSTDRWLAVLGGVLAVWNPTGFAIAITVLIGAWTFVSGLVRIFIGIAVRPMPHWRVMLIAGVLGVVIGLYIITQPVVGTVVLVWALGIYAIVYGAGRIVQGLSSGPAGGQATL